MQQTVFPYGADTIHDYRIILDTPLAVKKKITAVKISFDQDYRGMIIAGGMPFVYLAMFSQRENAEQDMIDKLDRIALGFMPFKVHLKNFRRIEASEIFIGIEEKNMLQELVCQIKGALSDAEAQYNELPRISIGQNLQPWQFEKSWKSYERQHFSATFLVNEMLLLKRMAGFRNWQILKRLKFENMVMVS